MTLWARLISRRSAVEKDTYTSKISAPLKLLQPQSSTDRVVFPMPQQVSANIDTKNEQSDLPQSPMSPRENSEIGRSPSGNNTGVNYGALTPTLFSPITTTRSAGLSVRTNIDNNNQGPLYPLSPQYQSHPNPLGSHPSSLGNSPTGYTSDLDTRIRGFWSPRTNRSTKLEGYDDISINSDRDKEQGVTNHEPELNISQGTDNHDPDRSSTQSWEIPVKPFERPQNSMIISDAANSTKGGSLKAFGVFSISIILLISIVGLSISTVSLKKTQSLEKELSQHIASMTITTVNPTWTGDRSMSESPSGTSSLYLSTAGILPTSTKNSLHGLNVTPDPEQTIPLNGGLTTQNNNFDLMSFLYPTLVATTSKRMRKRRAYHFTTVPQHYPTPTAGETDTATPVPTSLFLNFTASPHIEHRSYSSHASKRATNPLSRLHNPTCYEFRKNLCLAALFLITLTFLTLPVGYFVINGHLGLQSEIRGKPAGHSYDREPGIVVGRNTDSVLMNTEHKVGHELRTPIPEERDVWSVTTIILPTSSVDTQTTVTAIPRVPTAPLTIAKPEPVVRYVRTAYISQPGVRSYEASSSSANREKYGSALRLIGIFHSIWVRFRNFFKLIIDSAAFRMCVRACRVSWGVYSGMFQCYNMVFVLVITILVVVVIVFATQFVAKFKDWVINPTKAAWNLMKEKFKDLWVEFQGFINEKIKGMITEAAGNVEEKISQANAEMKAYVDKLKNKFGDLGEKTKDEVKNTLKDLPFHRREMQEEVGILLELISLGVSSRTATAIPTATDILRISDVLLTDSDYVQSSAGTRRFSNPIITLDLCAWTKLAIVSFLRFLTLFTLCGSLLLGTSAGIGESNRGVVSIQRQQHVQVFGPVPQTTVSPTSVPSSNWFTSTTTATRDTSQGSHSFVA